METISRIKQSRADQIFDAVNYSLLALVIIIFIYPLWFVIIASISDPNSVWSGQVIFLPKKISFDGYLYIMENDDVWRGYMNTIFYTLIGVTINLVVTMSAAYPLSRKEFMIRGFLMKLYTFTMYFSGGLIPLYILVKNLGMVNTRWALLIPGAMSVWHMIVTRTFLATTIPNELYEAAHIDGCNNFRMLFLIVLPLSIPIIAVMALFYGVGHWNAFFAALIFLTDRDLFPLQLILREILIQSQITMDMLDADPEQIQAFLKLAEVLKYGLIIVSTLPILAVYPFVQKYFIKGLMIGSIKG